MTHHDSRHLPASRRPNPYDQGAVIAPIAGLSREARRLLSQSVSPNTVRAMRADLKVYQKTGGVLPASEIDIANFLSAQNALGKAPATLTRYANSLHMWHRYHNVPSPVKSMAVRSVLRGIRKSRDTRQASSPALRLEELHRLLDGLNRDTLHGLRDSALFLLCFYGAFRRSEVVVITCEDLEWRAKGLLVTLHHSKTNHSHRIETKSIMRAPPGAPYCPVTMLERWLAASGIQKGAIFRGITPKGRLGAGRMTANTLTACMRRALTTAGLTEEGYSPHSFRAGFITEAHLRGKNHVQIMRITGHRDPRSFEKYIRIADAFENHGGDFFGT